MSVFWLLVGLVGLWAGSSWALGGTIEVAERRGLSQGFLGVTVLAIGTDLPEVLVAVTGAIHQWRGEPASGVVVGNAVGSALAQGSLVLGLAGLFGHLHMSRHTLRRDGAVLLFAIVALALLATGQAITRIEGAMLLTAYGIYAWRLGVHERQRDHKNAVPWRSLKGPLLRICAGLIVVLACAELIVHHALLLAASRGWDTTMIGMFLVGAGTSLPELALSLGAVVRGRAGLAVGNLMGSNVFDLLVPVGLSAVLHPLIVDAATVRVDLPVLLALTGVALWSFARRRGIQRGEAYLLIGGYLGFTVCRVLG